MEIFILNENFENLYIIDTFESFIWTERYNGCGNFEFYTPINQALLDIVHDIQFKMQQKIDYYVSMKGYSSIMVIEEMEIVTDVEEGNRLIISGRGLESILDRRIIWTPSPTFSFYGNLQEGVKKLIDQNIINSQAEYRNIANFKFNDSDNEYITGLEFQAQFTGDNIYDAVLAICESFGLGFDLELDSSKNIVFSLKYGEDRSYDQNKNPYVIFSPGYENIINSDYLESPKTFKNVVLVAGEGQGTERKFKAVGIDGSDGSGTSGMSRREMFVDARDIQSDTQDGQITDEEYQNLLKQRGFEKLAENPYIKAFTGEIEATKMFVYGKDFFKGDIVQIKNEYGMETKAKITEVVTVLDNNGYKTYPTFQVMEEGFK